MTPNQQIALLNEAESIKELQRLHNVIVNNIDQFNNEAMFRLLATYKQCYDALKQKQGKD